VFLDKFTASSVLSAEINVKQEKSYKRQENRVIVLTIFYRSSKMKLSSNTVKNLAVYFVDEITKFIIKYTFNKLENNVKKIQK